MKSIVILASGKGSNTEHIIKYFQKSTTVKVSLVVSNKADAGVLKIAEANNIPQLVLQKEELALSSTLDKINAYQPDLIVLAGFLLQIPPSWVQSYPNKIINIHPALLPKFGGKGMYGMHVHQAAIMAREANSGITIHYVNEHYDEGSPILQAYCPILPDDTAEKLAQKVGRLEYRFLSPTIEYLLDQQ